jgi:hypothetical protein
MFRIYMYVCVCVCVCLAVHTYNTYNIHITYICIQEVGLRSKE